MPLSLVQVTPPATEPVSVDEFKMHLRLDTDAQDTMLATLLMAARQMLEKTVWRQFITATWALSLDAWQPLIELPRPPLASMVPTVGEPDLGIAYIDTTGMVQVLDPASYQVDMASQPGRVLLSSMPALGTGLTPVTITYQAGYGDLATDVPAPLRQAILLFAADMYEHTEAQAEQRLQENTTVCRLLGPYRHLEMY
jgi:uncharacterized phiE125 gp8 family phage protein